MPHLYIHIRCDGISGPTAVHRIIHSRLNAGDCEPLASGEAGKLYDNDGKLIGAWRVQEELVHLGPR